VYLKFVARVGLAPRLGLLVTDQRVRFFPRLWTLALRLNDIEGVSKDEHSEIALAQRVIDEISRVAAVLMPDTKQS